MPPSSNKLLSKYAATIEETESIRLFNEAVSLIPSAPLANDTCLWASLPLVACHDGDPLEAWEHLDPVLLNAISTSFPPHKVDDLVRVGPKGLIRAVLFVASATADHEHVTPELYQDKLAMVVDAIQRRYVEVGRP